MSDTTFADRKAAFLRGEIEQWQIDHAHTDYLFNIAAIVRDATWLIGDVFAEENRHQIQMPDLPSGHVPADAQFSVALALVLGIAEATDALVCGIEDRGHAVEGVGALRAAIEEAKAALAPSYELPPAMAALADAALADHAAGKTLAWE